MSPDDLRRACLERPGAGEEFPFGPETSVFKVEGKMFALSALGSPALRVSLKCEPALAEQLRDAHLGSGGCGRRVEPIQAVEDLE